MERSPSGGLPTAKFAGLENGTLHICFDSFERTEWSMDGPTRPPTWLHSALSQGSFILAVFDETERNR
uniref:Uncharacterized protein n=1 Tax=Romanomermis culicivorax TaxID=13658 RepID=A0A915I3R6_ROMCU